MTLTPPDGPPDTAALAEERRQLAVTACQILDTPRETAFDSIVFTAAQLFRVPMAMLAVVDAERIWSKASVGPIPRQMSRPGSFCTTVVERDQFLVVEDATTEGRFNDLPIVSGHPGVRFYAGLPLHGPGGTAIAVLCVLDRMPRTVPDRARLQLQQLGREAEDLLLLRSPLPDFTAL